MAAGFGCSISTKKRFGKTTMSTQSDADRSSQSIYEAVLSTVDAQTSPKQAPVCYGHELSQILVAHAGIDGPAVDKAVRAAVQNDDLLVLDDPRDGTPMYLPTDVETLRRGHGWLAELETETQREHAWLNQVIAEVEDA